MRILCCLDGANSERMYQAVTKMLRSEDGTLGLIYVIDNGPQGEMERQRERLFRRPGLPHERQAQMKQAEESSAMETLTEGGRYLPGAEQILRAGRPEREIVACAEIWRADVVVIGARTQHRMRPQAGPKSVGHVARFVLDHCPCPVLLLRV